ARRAGRPQAHAHLAGGARVALGGVAGSGLLADQHVAQALEVVQRIVDRQHGAAGKAEDEIHTLSLQALQHDPRPSLFHDRLPPWGPRDGPHTPHRSARPGTAGSPLVNRSFTSGLLHGRPEMAPIPPTARHAPAQPGRPSSTAPSRAASCRGQAFGAPSAEASRVRMRAWAALSRAIGIMNGEQETYVMPTLWQNSTDDGSPPCSPQIPT